MNGRYTKPQTTLILGVGNIIMGDDGFGIHVVRHLKGIPLPHHVRIEEGGVGGFNLLGSLDGITRLIVVDVMMVDAAPGELCLLKSGPDLAEPDKNIVSFHQVGVLELVQMWSLLGNEPETYFLVTRPQKLAWSTELSTPIQAAVTKAVNLLQDLCRDNFASLERSPEICTS